MVACYPFISKFWVKSAQQHMHSLNLFFIIRRLRFIRPEAEHAADRLTFHGSCNRAFFVLHGIQSSLISENRIFIFLRCSSEYIIPVTVRIKYLMSPGLQKGNRCKIIGIPAGTPIGNHNVFIQCSGREILIVIDTVVKHDRDHTG